MDTVKSQIVFRGTEVYHFTDYFKKHPLNSNGESYELMDVRIVVEPMSPHIIGRLEITQVALTIQGETFKVQSAEEKLRKHFMTAGG